jgi:hypothetical protein
MLNYFAQLLRNWRNFLVVIKEKTTVFGRESGVGVFNKAAFLNTSPNESTVISS